MQPRFFAILGAILVVGFGAFLALSDSRTTAYLSTPEEIAKGLDDRIASFTHAFNNHDYAAITAAVPPRMIAAMAAEMDLSERRFKKQLVNLTAGVMEVATVHDISMTPGEIRLAGSLSYALLATETDISVIGQRNTMQTTTVALLENGAWYLARVESAAQTELLRSVYPELADVEF